MPTWVARRRHILFCLKQALAVYPM